jgi:type II restriction/modification system DNA methylase subunit YeeA
MSFSFAARDASRASYEQKLEKSRTSFDDEVLRLKVLDPSMGSGHFLVRATEYLAEEIATNPYAYEEHAPDDETAIDYWKRKVVESCIFGVDINPLAVELAKLSLWLATVARGKPLSFLDHHLRCGNSVIFANLKDLKFPPKTRKNNYLAINRFRSLMKASLHKMWCFCWAIIKSSQTHQVIRLSR